MSKVKTRKVFAVWTNTDLTEGRGTEYIECYTELRSTAIRLARGNYVMGTDSRVTEVTMFFKDGRWYAPGVLIIEPSQEDLREERKIEAEIAAAEAKARALVRAKELGLSDDEIAALKG